MAENDQPIEVMVKWIASEMKIMRQQMTDIARYMREAEDEIPESLRRFMNYYHDVHDIKYMHEELGHPAPDYIMKELERLTDRYRQILKELLSDQGALEKIRRKMAEDKENIYDHTRELEFKGKGARG